jgi:hypothetical protein
MKLDAYKKTRSGGTDRRWTLLFIGDHGNVISIKRFKAIIIAVGCLFLLVFAFLAFLFFSNQKARHHITDLRKRYQYAQQQVETLRHEKEILMARLVVAESKAKEKMAESRPPRESRSFAKASDTEAPAVAQPKPVLKPQEKSAVPQARRPELADNQTRAAEMVMQVAVENFNVARESENNRVSAQFKIKNTSRGSQRAVGKAVVIFKGADLKKDQWLVMPSVALADNKPTGKRGKRFSIQRFRTMNFRSKAPDHAHQFQTAVVYVFSKSGQMLLEQNFAIQLQPLPVASSQPQTEQTSSRKVQPSKTPPRRKTSTETPPAEDVLETLEKAPPVF